MARVLEKVCFLLTPLFELHRRLRGVKPGCIHGGVFPFPATYATFKVTLLLGSFVIRQLLAIVGASFRLILFQNIIRIGWFIAGEERVIGMAAVPTAQPGAGAVKNERVIN